MEIVYNQWQGIRNRELQDVISPAALSVEESVYACMI
jgi:hypothetical protein